MLREQQETKKPKFTGLKMLYRNGFTTASHQSHAQQQGVVWGVAAWCTLVWPGNGSFVVKVRGKQTNSFAECHHLPVGHLSVGVKGVGGKTGVEMS